MQFKLSFTPRSPQQLINYKQPVLLTGSCFSDHIAAYLKNHSFKTVSQPNGIVFNPLSIANQLKRISLCKLYKESELLQFNELWHSWQHHGSFSGIDKSEVIGKMNDSLNEANQVLCDSKSIVVITLGSAWVYELINGYGETVANCHKYPRTHFNKRLLGVNEIVEAFQLFIQSFKGAMIYFTVSPVRHIRDGLVENNLSKSVLLQAVHSLCDRYKERCYYFPSFEIVMDELRDYRFYNEDMLHPNDQAAEYVWQRFITTCMDNETRSYIKDVAELNSMNNHKVMHPETETFQKFEAARKLKKELLMGKYGVK